MKPPQKFRRELRHRVGSLLIAGVESTSLSPVEAAWLRTLQPSGIILFRCNIESPAQLHALFQQASSSLDHQFFRCVDLEGGTVDRLRDLIGPTPSAAEAAATGSAAIFRAHGALIGRMLHSLGFNVDLAPVLDLALPACMAVMRTRVVSAEPAAVVRYAREFLIGLSRYKVLGCGKHFPGLGGGTLDSHHATPKIDRTWDQIYREDLEPYRALAASLPMVMVSHAAYPKIERPVRPASTSRFWIEEVLRRKLKYRGLVVSDDMEMGALLDQSSLDDAAVEAIAAGTDLLEICHSPERILGAYEALLREAERSPAFALHVARAATRVATAKRLHLRGALPKAVSSSGLEKLRDAQQRLRKQIALKTPPVTA